MVHLEERLSCAVRARPTASPPRRRAALSERLTPTFDALASLTRAGQCAQRGTHHRAGPPLMKWLIPRLADFGNGADIDVRITTGGAAANGEDWSCGIKLGDGEWSGPPPSRSPPTCCRCVPRSRTVNRPPT
jgi:LysR family glycine cleavage system transcriptional activator